MTSNLNRFCRRSRAAFWAWLSLSLAVAGCGRDDIKVYKVANTEATQPPAAAQSGLPPMPGDSSPSDSQAGAPQMAWVLPPGWMEKQPGGMRFASFSAPGKNDRLVDISIVPLAGMAGGDWNNVNLWRSQVGLEPISQTDFDLPSPGRQQIPMGNGQAALYDIVGKATNGTAANRVLAATFSRDQVTWFFKAIGDDASVGAQKDNFIAFLKSIQFVPPAGATPAGNPQLGGATPPAAPPADSAALPAWTVPPGWQPAPLTPMVLAKFAVAADGQKAEVSISAFPGDVGSLLSKVNRWRNQVALPPLDENDLAANVSSVQLPTGAAPQVDFTGTDAKSGQPARMVVLTVQINGTSWFYKLMGDPALVDKQKAAFLQFVQSAKY